MKKILPPKLKLALILIIGGIASSLLFFFIFAVAAAVMCNSKYNFYEIKTNIKIYNEIIGKFSNEEPEFQAHIINRIGNFYRQLKNNPKNKDTNYIRALEYYKKAEEKYGENTPEILFTPVFVRNNFIVTFTDLLNEKNKNLLPKWEIDKYYTLADEYYHENLNALNPEEYPWERVLCCLNQYLLEKSFYYNFDNLNKEHLLKGINILKYDLAFLYNEDISRLLYIDQNIDSLFVSKDFKKSGVDFWQIEIIYFLASDYFELSKFENRDENIKKSKFILDLAKSGIYFSQNLTEQQRDELKKTVVINY